MPCRQRHGAVAEAAFRRRAEPHQEGSRTYVVRPCGRPEVRHSPTGWGVTDRAEPSVAKSFPQTSPRDTQMTLRSARRRTYHFQRNVLAINGRPRSLSRQVKRMPDPSHPTFSPTIGEQHACSSHPSAAAAADILVPAVRVPDAQQGKPHRPAARLALEANTVRRTTHSGPAANDFAG